MLGALDKAVAYHLQALTVVRDAGFRQGECAVYNELGRTLLARGDLRSALEQHQRAADCATRIQYRYGEARALDGIAACLRDTDPEGARRYWVRALRLYHKLEVPERYEVERHLAELAAA
jgi:tetratricopeptide (TPR) repeat protein